MLCFIFVVYVFLGEHDAMVGFVRCLNEHADMKLYAVIHVRGLDAADDLQTVHKLGLFCKFTVLN